MKAQRQFDELLEFVESVSHGPYRDSDLSSLMETLQKRAGYLVEKVRLAGYARQEDTLKKHGYNPEA